MCTHAHNVHIILVHVFTGYTERARKFAKSFHKETNEYKEGGRGRENKHV